MFRWYFIYQVVGAILCLCRSSSNVNLLRKICHLPESGTSQSRSTVLGTSLDLTYQLSREWCTVHRCISLESADSFTGGGAGFYSVNHEWDGSIKTFFYAPIQKWVEQELERGGNSLCQPLSNAGAAERSSILLVGAEGLDVVRRATYADGSRSQNKLDS
ncbi:hypothetical protein B0H13DRAFT_1874024 [Mycena leptocephala]|nr:hypothetical protein B0H13DRAFT_1874024 [Mycena leptocephala]